MDYVIDATNQKLGRLASKIAYILQGKLSPSYERNVISKDRVTVKNIDKITVTGRKADQKIYYHHTGYMGHLRKKTYRQMFEKKPKEVLRIAVKRMLPKNWLADKRLNNLVIE